MDWSYIACFIDTDGCITFEYRHYKNKIYIYPRIFLTNTNNEVIVKIQKFLGYGYIYSETINKWKNKPTIYYLQISGRKKIAHFLKNVIPHLIIKKDKAIKAYEIVVKRISKIDEK